ncbi:MAG: SAM-dependent methyltransferase [Kiritimatiellae bacterium]|nr:SAM-dependent methyltransferase [Kiritimatiellia bacterium]
MAEIKRLPGCAFLSFPQMEELLREELLGRFGMRTPPVPASGGKPDRFIPGEVRWYGPILYCPAFRNPERVEALPYWAQTAFRAPMLLTIESAGDAAKAMMALQRNWASCQYQLWRRAELIERKLPFIPTKPRTFPFDFPTTPMGIFTLVNDRQILASAETSSDLALGALPLVEDHTNPPSRAYLKLQESLAYLHHDFGVPYPAPGERCFDAGACPGGWTWVMRQCGAEVYAVDRTELHPLLMRDPKVTFRAHDAFTLTPEELGAFDWVVSDVICYPDRLLPWVRRWIASGRVKHMVCTIKLQGEVDWQTIEPFTQIPNSRVRHLTHNKHELTFLYAGEEWGTGMGNGRED